MEAVVYRDCGINCTLESAVKALHSESAVRECESAVQSAVQSAVRVQCALHYRIFHGVPDCHAGPAFVLIKTLFSGFFFYNS